MSVSNSTAKVQYTLTSATQALSVPFHFLANGDVKAINTDSSNVDTTLVESTNYTLTGAGNEAGGTLTMIGGTIGDVVTIKRDIDITQLTDYVANDSFPASVQERGLDKLTMVAQATNEQAGRSIQFPESETGSPSNVIGPAATRKGKILSFDATTGEVKTDISLSDIAFDDTPVTIADTKTSLEAVDVSSVSDKAIAYLRGRLSAFDGGGGIYVLDKSGTLGASANNGGTILVAAGGSNWYWRRSDTRTIDVITFGADPTGAADSYTEINAAMTTGNPVYFPAGTYLVQTTLKIGDGNSTRLFGAGQSNTTIKNDTDDVFDLGSGSGGISDMRLSDLTIESDSGGGHIFTVQNTVSKSKVMDLTLNQKNGGKAVWFNDVSGYEGGNMFQRLHIKAASTGTISQVPWYNAGKQVMNGCAWEDCRIDYSRDGLPFFKIDNQGTSYHTQNYWRSLTFELCYGGLIELRGARFNLLEGCQVYDNSKSYQNYAIYIGQGSAGGTLNSSRNIIRHYYRHTTRVFAWVTATAYGANEFISHGGSNYKCILAHTASASDEPGVGGSWSTYWQAAPLDPVDIYLASSSAAGNCMIEQCASLGKIAIDFQNARTLVTDKLSEATEADYSNDGYVTYHGIYSDEPLIKRGDNGIFWGTGSPESVVDAGPGSVYIQTDGASQANLWVKSSGTSTTNWKKLVHESAPTFSGDTTVSAGKVIVSTGQNIGNSAGTTGCFYSGTDWYVQTDGTTSFKVDSNHDVYPAKAAGASMTEGFLRIPSDTGAPTGTPSAVSGKVPLYYDTTNNKLYVYNGSWKSTAALT